MSAVFFTLSDAVQHLLASTFGSHGYSGEDAIAANWRRSKDFFAELIFRDQFKGSRIGLEHKRLATFVGDKDVSSDHPRFN